MIVRFFEPSRFYAAQRHDLQQAFDRVLSSDRIVLGPEVERFEQELAELVGARFAVSLASGTDAVELALRALELPPQARVVCPNFTAVATATAIVRAGLTPVLVDVDAETLTLDPERAAAASEVAAIVAVHLYGRAAPVGALIGLGGPVVEDASQAHGLDLDGARAGSVGICGCFSFYPTKNLGAFGDGGAVTTSDAAAAERVRMLASYGREADGLVRSVGLNSRLDELQAAFLRVRLRRFEIDTRRRADIARAYDDALGRHSPDGVHHLYVVRSPRRDELRGALAEQGIETAVHYPYTISEQPVFAGHAHGPLTASEAAAREVLSLPSYPHLTDAEVEAVAAALRGHRDAFGIR